MPLQQTDPYAISINIILSVPSIGAMPLQRDIYWESRELLKPFSPLNRGYASATDRLRNHRSCATLLSVPSIGAMPLQQYQVLRILENYCLSVPSIGAMPLQQSRR